MTITYNWRGLFTNKALNRLHADGFQHRELADDWWAQVNRHSLGWVCANQGDDLVGFVNVAWDGGIHAFILDTLVADQHRHRGIATEMIGLSAKKAREARCEWLHVDFGDNLRGFYFNRCGFDKTNGGVIKLLQTNHE